MPPHWIEITKINNPVKNHLTLVYYFKLCYNIIRGVFCLPKRHFRDILIKGNSKTNQGFVESRDMWITH